jgi:uncharacterized protein (TIGR02246 family)
VVTNRSSKPGEPERSPEEDDMSGNAASVEAFFEQAAHVWKTNDGHAFADLFTDDGSLINPFGERADGRAAIGEMYSTYFKGMLGGTSNATTVQSVRALGDDHAFVDGDQSVTGADGQVVLAVHLAALLRRDGDSWRFVDARPYVYPEIPGGAAAK